jgi:hypothetical protein
VAYTQPALFKPEEMGPVPVKSTRTKASTHKRAGLRSHPKARRLVIKTN